MLGGLTAASGFIATSSLKIFRLPVLPSQSVATPGRVGNLTNCRRLARLGVTLQEAKNGMDWSQIDFSKVRQRSSLGYLSTDAVEDDHRKAVHNLNVAFVR